MKRVSRWEKCVQAAPSMRRRHNQASNLPTAWLRAVTRRSSETGKNLNFKVYREAETLDPNTNVYITSKPESHQRYSWHGAPQPLAAQLSSQACLIDRSRNWKQNSMSNDSGQFKVMPSDSDVRFPSYC